MDPHHTCWNLGEELSGIPVFWIPTRKRFHVNMEWSKRYFVVRPCAFLPFAVHGSKDSKDEEIGNWRSGRFQFDLCFDFFQVFDKVSKTAEKQVLFKVPSWKPKVWNGESSVWVGYGAMKWSWFRSNMESSKLKNRDSTLRVPKLNPNRYLGIHSDPMV